MRTISFKGFDFYSGIRFEDMIHYPQNDIVIFW